MPWVGRVEDWAEDMFGTYGGARLWSFLIEAGRVPALVILAYGARLYRRSRLERLLVAGKI